MSISSSKKIAPRLIITNLQMFDENIKFLQSILFKLQQHNKIDFTENRCLINFPASSQVFVSFSRVTFKV